MSTLTEGLYKSFILYMSPEPARVEGMKIGIFTYDFDPPIGGLGVHVKRLLDGMKKVSGHDFIVFSPSPSAPTLLPSILRNRWNEKGGSPLYSLFLIFLLPKLITRSHLDLIHVHSGSGGVIVLRKPSIPLIVTVHHTYLAETSHVFMNNLPKRWWKKFMARLEKRTYRLADQIHCVSEDTKKDLTDVYGIDSHKILVIENSLDNSQFLEPKEHSGNQLLYIGRMEPRKGIHVLLEAFELLLKEHSDVKLTIIGKNLLGQTFIDDLHKKFGEKIHILGHIDESELRSYLQTSTMLIVPSLVEGFGLTAAEGMAAGICVIGSNSPGIRSILKDSETGILFKSGDPFACKDAIHRALKDADLRERLGREARSVAASRFTLEIQTQKTLRAYEDAKR